MKKHTRRIGWVLAAAVAAVAVGSFVPATQAQYRVGNDGRALDANNRIGSGGINEAPAPGAAGPYTGAVGGNQIVTGNVTAGQQFRGFVPYTDPFSFRGPTAGAQIDRFIRGTSGVPISGAGPNNNANTVLPFYGVGQTVERPPGFVEAVPGTGYVPAPRLSREAGDLRLGRPFDAPEIRTPQPGQLILPGPVDPNTQQQTVVTASPLYGVRMWNFGEQADREFLDTLATPGLQRSRLDERTLQRLRDELRRDVSLEGETPDGETETPDGARPLDQPMDDRFGAQQGLRLSLDDRVDSRVGSSLSTDVRPGNLAVNTPERQSAQYAEMRRRFNRFNQLPEAVAQWEEYQQQQARARGEEPSDGGVARTGAPGERAPGAPGAGADPMVTPDPTRPGATPGLPGTDPGAIGTQPPQQQQQGIPGVPDYGQRSKDILAGTDEGEGEQTTPGTDRPQVQPPGTGTPPGADQAAPKPVDVTSLATGVPSKAVSDFIAEAEQLMREGKFYSALDQFEMADQVQPDHPMVNLGRAIAELGASYYARADQHLREAFNRDPALLMGRYDLKTLLGQERLEFIVNDLRALANKEANEPRHVFLLAFIDYNTGNARRAAAYLDLAERRAGKPEPLYQNMRKFWNLPAAQEDPNK